MTYMFNFLTMVLVFVMKPYRQFHLWLLNYADIQLDYIVMLTNQYRSTYSYRCHTSSLDLQKIEALYSAAMNLTELNRNIESASDIRYFFMSTIALKWRYSTLMEEMESRSAWYALFEEMIKVA